MPERGNEEIQLNLADLLKKSRRRFGELLHDVCDVAGLTQGKLAREANAERQRLIAEGKIYPEDFTGSMGQPTVSRVMAGLQEPTYFQVFIWLRVIRDHYSSAHFARICEELGIAVPEFSADLERMLWKLSFFLPPDELASVYEKSKNEKPLDSSPSLIDHKEERMH
jgi:hypothetical protein